MKLTQCEKKWIKIKEENDHSKQKHIVREKYICWEDNND